jgi:hypothetical protein
MGMTNLKKTDEVCIQSDNLENLSNEDNKKD